MGKFTVEEAVKDDSVPLTFVQAGQFGVLTEVPEDREHLKGQLVMGVAAANPKNINGEFATAVGYVITSPLYHSVFNYRDSKRAPLYRVRLLPKGTKVTLEV